VTGHANEMKPADLKEYAQFNRDFVADVQAASKGGKTPDDVANSWTIPAKYQGYAPISTPNDKVRVKNNANLAWKELGDKTTTATSWKHDACAEQGSVSIPVPLPLMSIAPPQS